MEALDAHCHIDILINVMPSIYSFYTSRKLGGITWSYNENIDSWGLYPSYWDKVAALCEDLTEKNIPFYYLLGIHPRSIPQDLASEKELPEPLLESFIKHLQNPRCLGLGELGLDRGSQEEEKILRWQLEWAEENLPKAKRIGFHTPRKNKKETTAKLLDILDLYKTLHSSVLIDHVTIETFPMVYERGYKIGITLQDGKVSVEDLLIMLDKWQSQTESVVLNSDSAVAFSEPYREWLDTEPIREKVLFRLLSLNNAVNFFGISL